METEMAYRRITSRLLTILACISLIGLTQYVFGQCDWEETQKLIASDGVTDDYFGFSVAIDGNTMVVGAYLDDDNGTDSGAAYVFRYDPDGSGQWVQEVKLLPSDGVEGAEFGHSVAIDGDRIVVGAPHDFGSGFRSGSAYVFQYDPDGSGQWIEESELVPDEDSTGSLFGWSVSIDGDVIAVGAEFDERNWGDYTGSVSMFRYDPNGSGQWVLEAWFTPTQEDASSFGYAVSVVGDAVAVGAPGTDKTPFGYHAGAAYVYRYDPSSWPKWKFEDELEVSDWDAWDKFGISVDMDSDAIVVGAYWNDDNGSQSGSAYVFRHDGSDWVEETKLLASDATEFGNFGSSVSISGDAIGVGAFGEIGFNGAAYVFQYDPDGSGQWIEDSKLIASDGAYQDYFGQSVSIDGDTILVGAYLGDGNGSDSGSAYVFDLTTCIPTLTISPEPLIAGQDGTFTADYVNPNTQTFLAYSLGGLGSTYIPQLNITLDLSQPAQAGNTITSDIDGTAEWVLLIPGIAAGRVIWFQACQYELKTNVVATNIE